MKTSISYSRATAVGPRLTQLFPARERRLYVINSQRRVDADYSLIITPEDVIDTSDTIVPPRYASAPYIALQQSEASAPQRPPRHDIITKAKRAAALPQKAMAAADISMTSYQNAPVSCSIHTIA